MSFRESVQKNNKWATRGVLLPTRTVEVIRYGGPERPTKTKNTKSASEYETWGTGKKQYRREVIGKRKKKINTLEWGSIGSQKPRSDYPHKLDDGTLTEKKTKKKKRTKDGNLSTIRTTQSVKGAENKQKRKGREGERKYTDCTPLHAVRMRFGNKEDDKGKGLMNSVPNRFVGALLRGVEELKKPDGKKKGGDRKKQNRLQVTSRK